MDTAQKPLRILAIVNLAWDPRLGASRVWMELADQWRAQGHIVEKFSLSDAFPGVRATRVTFALRQVIFVRKVAAHVRKHGHRFDVIDALVGTLPFAKETLGFKGLVVARSVGLYLLYDRFERTLEKRWPRRSRGKFVGRLLYGFTRRRLLRASEKAVQHADLVNVPNSEEADCLRAEFGSDRRVIVQPYGLTEERRRALLAGAASTEIRLKEKRVCFIGMWGARKGAHDWPEIIQGVRKEIPGAKFRFLGTMLEAGAIRADLGDEAAREVEFISAFQPDELPALLGDCTAAAFPSYVEGFGLAVIEQLAAGLPVIAYDTAGPRDILQRVLPESLVPSGGTEEFAAALCRVLRSDPAAYREQSRRCVELAASYSWPQIARDTLRAYQTARQEQTAPIVFVQPFSIGSAGGGARILRALLEQAPQAWRSVCTAPEKPRSRWNEVHLPSRPFWGRVEHSRLAAMPNNSWRFFARAFRQRLLRYCREVDARAIHAVPHGGLDFAEAHAVARELSLPFFISLHDDLAYTALGIAGAKEREAAIGRAWKEATARFVITEALGREYCRRYGEREFQVVTDGVSQLGTHRTPADPNRLRVYFMGLFHFGYERNLRALLEAIAIFERNRPGMEVQVTLRCEHVRPQVLAGVKDVTILPFADEAQVQRDLEDADLLYMPLHFADTDENFTRYSLSTKMVTYVGSGVPILYHGPTTSAAYHLLDKNRAAIAVTSLSPEAIAVVLAETTPESRATVANNALELARREFMLADQTRKFWSTLSECLATR